MFPLTLADVTLHRQMKKIIYILILVFAALFVSSTLQAQCSVCTKTASQLGEKPAQGMNAAILYLMMTPFAIVGFIGYRWWKGNKKLEQEELLSQQPAK
jgi:hypothetical protein